MTANASQEAIVIACKRDMVTAAFDLGYSPTTVAMAMNEPERDLRRALRFHQRFDRMAKVEG